MTYKEIVEQIEEGIEAGGRIAKIHNLPETFLTKGYHDILDFINRQQAEIKTLKAEADKYYNAAKIQQDVSMKRFFEIKRLTEENERLQKLLDDKCDRCIAKERAEAVKEFAELVKANRNLLFNNMFSGFHFNAIISSLVKQMVGDAE